MLAVQTWSDALRPRKTRETGEENQPGKLNGKCRTGRIFSRGDCSRQRLLNGSLEFGSHIAKEGTLSMNLMLAERCGFAMPIKSDFASGQYSRVPSSLSSPYRLVWQAQCRRNQ
ncbi:hypothetical protein CSKR_203701 [Clonorchis sinensis]|uniref:Uncharacterized protein n=1 Tax=Clonorchis sinensis TaxID=79923 RepID=A0A8T1N0F4_CLOSI|nr:hypothetical protein CSKR_203701 [Clonorchis sinensis]